MTTTLDDAKRLCRELAEALDAIDAGRTEPLFNEFWIAVNMTGQIETAKECIRLLGPFADKVVVTTKPESMLAILPPLMAYVFVVAPHTMFVGGFYAKPCWSGVSFEAAQGWRMLKEYALECAKLTCTSKVRIDYESLMRPILAGDTVVDIDALKEGIAESGIGDAQIDWRFHGAELLPGNTAALQLSPLLARLFPSALMTDSNYGRPAWVSDAAHQLCEKGMRQVWPNRLTYRILVDHLQDPYKHHYQPAEIVEAIKQCPGPVSVWLNTASGWTYESKLETAQATAAALEASS